jgi:hypothetical protein
MLRGLRKRAIALLWGGQALSAIGDEIYRVALIWLAVGLVGADAGYLAAAQSAALLVLSLVGGRWADRWDHRRTMIGVDALRALIALLPVVFFRAGPGALPLLVLVAVSLSGLGAFFDPALQATLPDVSDDAETLSAANGLMSTTARLARAIGPGIVGLLSGLIPTIHFFTLDAASFALSAASIAAIGRTRAEPAPAHAPARESLRAAFDSVRRQRTMAYLMVVKSIGGGIWSLSYALGLALLVHSIAPGDMRAFGLTIAAYGAGNLAGALFIGNVARRRPAFIVFCGYVWMGLGFVAMGFAPGLRSLAAACVWAGFGGPINDLPFVDLVQRLYPVREIPRVFRLRMAAETAAGLVLMSAAPWLLRRVPPRAVISGCGGIFLLFGLAGFARFAEKRGAAA